MIRRIIFWAHLGIGLATGVIIFLLCLTGAVLAFELQIVNWAEHDARARPEHPAAELLSPAEIAAKVTPNIGERIVSLEWSADQDMPVRVQTDKRSITVLNGYTGEVLGSGATGLRSFMRVMTELHVNLVLQLTGHWVVSIANVGFVFLIVSGLWLWWPRQWRWNQWRWPAFRTAMTPRWALSGKARDWNWHTTLGFWFLVPLLVIATSGLVLSFKAVDTWWRAFAGTHLVGPAIPPSVPHDAAAMPSIGMTTWSQRLAQMTEQHPGWRSLVLSGNGSPNKDGLLNCTINFGTPRQRAGVVMMKLDAQSGRIVETRRWTSDDGPVRARAIARLGHTGEIFGSIGQALGLLACLAGCVLVYTGFALSWRRFFGRSPKPAAPPVVAEQAD